MGKERALSVGVVAAFAEQDPALPVPEEPMYEPEPVIARFSSL